MQLEALDPKLQEALNANDDQPLAMRMFKSNKEGLKLIMKGASPVKPKQSVSNDLFTDYFFAKDQPEILDKEDSLLDMGNMFSDSKSKQSHAKEPVKQTTRLVDSRQDDILGLLPSRKKPQPEKDSGDEMVVLVKGIQDKDLG